jgi:predicted RNase H-like HicB family nuclease
MLTSRKGFRFASCGKQNKTIISAQKKPPKLQMPLFFNIFPKQFIELAWPDPHFIDGETITMRSIKYVVYREGRYYVSQCLNVDVSSFGETIDEAIASLKEAVSLYFEDEEGNGEYQVIGEALLGEDVIHA